MPSLTIGRSHNLATGMATFFATAAITLEEDLCHSCVVSDCLPSSFWGVVVCVAVLRMGSFLMPRRDCWRRDVNEHDEVMGEDGEMTGEDTERRRRARVKMRGCW